MGNNLTNLQITINGNSLVDGYNYHTLQTVARDNPRNVSDAAGLYDIQLSLIHISEPTRRS